MHTALRNFSSSSGVSNVLNLPTDSNIKQYKDFQIFHMQPVIENEKHGFRMFIAKSSKEYGSFCLKNQVWSTNGLQSYCKSI